MDMEFDAVEFGRYLQTRWRFTAIACGVALFLAVVISLLTPKRYTSTASLLIDPPAGNDPRAATAVSPAYLESLKTFERIALSDSLFVKAITQLKIPEARSGKSVESLKKAILKVSKLPNTKILEIDATLTDPRGAQAMAQFVAEHTVALSSALDTGTEDDVTRQARAILAAAGERLRQAQSARDTFGQREPVQTLEDEVANAGELRYGIRRDLVQARAELAEYMAQQPSDVQDTRESAWIKAQAGGVRARVTQLELQDQELSRSIAVKGALLERRKIRREMLEGDLEAARKDYEAANLRLNDLRASTGFRGERLQIIDPGIVPQRPSSPNLPLNVMVALLLALVASTVSLAYQFAKARNTRVREERVYSLR